MHNRRDRKSESAQEDQSIKDFEVSYWIVCRDIREGVRRIIGGQWLTDMLGSKSQAEVALVRLRHRWPDAYIGRYTQEFNPDVPEDREERRRLLGKISNHESQ